MVVAIAPMILHLQFPPATYGIDTHDFGFWAASVNLIHDFFRPTSCVRSSGNTPTAMVRSQPPRKCRPRLTTHAPCLRPRPIVYTLSLYIRRPFATISGVTLEDWQQHQLSTLRGITEPPRASSASIRRQFVGCSLRPSSTPSCKRHRICQPRGRTDPDTAIRTS